MTNLNLLYIFFLSVSTMICSQEKKIDPDCTGKLLVKLGDSIEDVEAIAELHEKSFDLSNKGNYVLFGWTKDVVFDLKPGFLGLEVVVIDLDNDKKVNRIQYHVDCYDGYLDCSGWKETSDKHLLDYFYCIPTLEKSLSSLKLKPFVLFENNEYKVSIHDLELNSDNDIFRRTILFETIE